MTPREQINYPDLNDKARSLEMRRLASKTDEPEVSDYEPWNQSSLHVSWLAADQTLVATFPGAGHVQVGLEVDVNYLRFAADTPNGATDDRTILWTDTLSPVEIDQLIRVLKRARRKAFPLND